MCVRWRPGCQNIKRLLLIKEKQTSQVREVSTSLLMGRRRGVGSRKSGCPQGAPSGVVAAGASCFCPEFPQGSPLGGCKVGAATAFVCGCGRQHVSLTRGIRGSRKTKGLPKWPKWETVAFWTKMMAVETEGSLLWRRMGRICWGVQKVGEWRKKLGVSVVEADSSESMWLSSKHFSWYSYPPAVLYHLFKQRGFTLNIFYSATIHSVVL